MSTRDWRRDALQFPRLLAEIRAVGLTDEQLAELGASMDLSTEEIDELFERAEKAFEKAKPPKDGAKIYCTTYCNQGHRLDNGKPVQHGCFILPPAAIEAERAGQHDRAIEILAAKRPFKQMKRGTK